jgi:hypothetical protein
MATTGFHYKYTKYSLYDIAQDIALPSEYRIIYRPRYYHGVAFEFFPLGISVAALNIHRWIEYGELVPPSVYRENVVIREEWEYIMGRDGVSKEEALEHLYAEKKRVYNLLKKKYKMKDTSFVPTQKYDIKDYDKVMAAIKRERRRQTWWGKLLGL